MNLVHKPSLTDSFNDLVFSSSTIQWSDCNCQQPSGVEDCQWIILICSSHKGVWMGSEVIRTSFMLFYASFLKIDSPLTFIIIKKRIVRKFFQNSFLVLYKIKIKKSYRFGKTWEWQNFGWIIPLHTTNSYKAIKRQRFNSGWCTVYMHRFFFI